MTRIQWFFAAVFMNGGNNHEDHHEMKTSRSGFPRACSLRDLRGHRHLRGEDISTVVTCRAPPGTRARWSRDRRRARG
jgi:hypothetical protein